MQIEPEVSFRNVQRTEFLDQAIRKGIEKLETVHDRITSVRLAVENLRASTVQDGLYWVRIEVTFPRGQVVVKEAPADGPHLPLEQVLNNAFDAARRKLREIRRQQQGQG